MSTSPTWHVSHEQFAWLRERFSHQGLFADVDIVRDVRGAYALAVLDGRVENACDIRLLGSPFCPEIKLVIDEETTRI